jgi:hypothetical protein
MATDEEIQNALLAIHSRLGTVEGKVTLIARADRDAILPVLEAAIRQSALIGQIYLLLDGKRTQKQIKEELDKHGINTTEMTVSNKVRDMATEYGIADLVSGPGAGKTYRKNRAMEDILNLSKRVEEWLKGEGETVPKKPARTKRGTRK